MDLISEAVLHVTGQWWIYRLLFVLFTFGASAEVYLSASVGLIFAFLS